MEKKRTNSGPLREPADKHSIYPPGWWYGPVSVVGTSCKAWVVQGEIRIVTPCIEKGPFSLHGAQTWQLWQVFWTHITLRVVTGLCVQASGYAIMFPCPK